MTTAAEKELEGIELSWRLVHRFQDERDDALARARQADARIRDLAIDKDADVQRECADCYRAELAELYRELDGRLRVARRIREIVNRAEFSRAGRGI